MRGIDTWEQNTQHTIEGIECCDSPYLRWENDFWVRMGSHSLGAGDEDLPKEVPLLSAASERWVTFGSQNKFKCKLTLHRSLLPWNDHPAPKFFISKWHCAREMECGSHWEKVWVRCVVFNSPARLPSQTHEGMLVPFSLLGTGNLTMPF